MSAVVPWAELAAVIERMPDEKTVMRLRHRLEANQLGEKIFEEVDRVLLGHGVRLSKGMLVDATIIAAPNSTKNATGERDPQVCSATRRSDPRTRPPDRDPALRDALH